MPMPWILRVSTVAPMALFVVEPIERPGMELMQSKNPESVTVAFRLALAHQLHTAKRVQMTLLPGRRESQEKCRVLKGAPNSP